MRAFEESKFEEQATLFVKEWTKLLSEGKFQEALDLLDIPKKEDCDFEWTAEFLKNLFLDYNGGEIMPTIDDPFLLSEKDFIRFYKYNNGTGWAVEYEIPMYGERSDLTSQFSFEKSTGNIYKVFLEDLHIM